MSPFWKKNQFQALEKALGKGKVYSSPEDLALYSMDATSFRSEPLVVVLPETAEDVQETVKFAIKQNLPITPRGAGSGLSGGSVPIEGGIVISFERMNKIEPIDTNNLTVRVEPGVVTHELQAKAAKFRLFYPPDPSSHTVSTIGGNVAENAGGLRCFKYGVTSHYVRGIEYVDASGDIKSTGSFTGEAFEPDMTPLLVGSEGTLGIFTRIELQLLKLPAATSSIAAFFSTRDSALQTVEEIVHGGIVPAIMEFIDKLALQASAQHVSYTYPENAGAMLLIETDGSEEQCAAEAKLVLEIVKNSALEVKMSSTNDERETLWKVRRGISPSLIRLATGRIHEDVAVPRGHIAELARRIDAISVESGLTIPIYGHAGDGNLHVVVLFDAEKSNEVELAKNTSHRIFRAALELGGTITGEHGVGCAKRDLLSWQVPASTLAFSKQIKSIFDPQGLFNPGKIFTQAEALD